MSAPPLPQGWKEAADPSSGNPYFYSTTGEVTWTRPTASAPGSAPEPQWHQEQQQPHQSQPQQGYQNSWSQPDAGYGGSGGSSWKSNSWSSNDQGKNSWGSSEPGPVETLKGTVKNWNDEKGFGFIAPENGSEDVFVHKNVTPDGYGLTVGVFVEFDKTYNPAKGKHNAQNIKVLEQGSPQAQQQPQQQYQQQYQQPAAQAPKSGELPLKAGWAEATCPTTGNTYFFKGQEVTWTRPEEEPVDTESPQKGTVKNFFVEKSFGFIVPDTGDVDLFIHKNNLLNGMESLSQGQRVIFKLSWNEKSCKYNAVALELDSSGEAAPATAGSYSSKSSAAPSNCLFITGIPKGSEDEYLTGLFGSFGEIETVKILPDTGKADLAGLLKFTEVDAATKALDAANSGAVPTMPPTMKVSYKKQDEKKSYGDSNSWSGASWNDSGNAWSGSDNRYAAY